MASEDTFDILARTPIIGLFEPNALRVIANVADIRRLRAQETLFREGDRSNGGYVVLQGSVAIGRDGSTDINQLGPASLIGRTALFCRTERPANAVATEDSAVLRISPTLMKRVLDEYPSAAGPMYDALAAELAATAAELEALSRYGEVLEQE